MILALTRAAAARALAAIAETRVHVLIVSSGTVVAVDVSPADLTHCLWICAQLSKVGGPGVHLMATLFEGDEEIAHWLYEGPAQDSVLQPS